MLKKIKDIFKVFSQEKDKEKAFDSFLKELQKLLISSDVEIKTVIEISKKIREKFEKEYIPGVDIQLTVKKILLDVLIDILGKEGGKLNIDKKPTYILLIGLYGHGKTTTTAKLGYYLKSKGYSVACLTLDTYRPAAYEQLKQLCEKVNLPFFGVPNEKDPLKIIDAVQDKLKQYKFVIVDTAGRDDLNEELVNEIKKIYEKLKPSEILLVIDAGIGRVAKRLAENFSKELPITGIIVTKFDSTAKGGGALVACVASNVKVKFIGTGEKIEDFEEFDPKKFLQKLLGFGDIEGLYKQFESVVNSLKKEEKELEESTERILSGKMTLKDFYLFIKHIYKESPLDKLFSFLPSFGLDDEEKIFGIAKERMKKHLIILQSFRESELLDHTKVLKNKRRLREIAIGAGVSENDVRALIEDFNRVKMQITVFLKNREFRVRGPFGKFMSRMKW